MSKDSGAPEGVRLWRPPPVIKQIYIPVLWSTDRKQREIWRDAFS
jgi:hypothetical protein